MTNMNLIRDKIKVAIRIRPINDSNDQIPMQVALKNIFIKEKCYSYDNVFDVYSSQEAIFETLVKPLIDSFLLGINTTIFAYGQTSSGKTHTMGTGYTEGCLRRTELGIIPRFLRHIFQLDSVVNGNARCSIQFLELYNEQIRDLFADKGMRSLIRLVDGKYGVTIHGLNLRNVNSVAESMASLSEGSRARITAPTAMNAESSRSHAVFTVILTQTFNGQSQSAKFNFVDLAGSERLARTNAVGTRAKEGININFGLLALGNVINALSEYHNDRGSSTKVATNRHIPYRDSKLTRLLEDSLGGSSMCLMIACISPSNNNVAETINTLNYATRVKFIENKICANPQRTMTQNVTKDVDNSVTTIKILQERVKELEREVTRLKGLSQESMFVKEVQDIMNLQVETNVNTYRDTIEHIESFYEILSLENDANILASIPKELSSNNSSLIYEKIALERKIKDKKQFLPVLNNGIQSPLSTIDNFMNKLEESTNINNLRLNNAVIKNAGLHKQLSKVKYHELRWQYLLNFISHKHMISDCLYRDIINQYETQLSNSYKVILSLVSSTEMANELIFKVKHEQPIISSSISLRRNPIMAMKNLDNRLNYLFPLGDDNQTNTINNDYLYKNINTNHNKIIPSANYVITSRCDNKPQAREFNEIHNLKKRTIENNDYSSLTYRNINKNIPSIDYNTTTSKFDNESQTRIFNEIHNSKRRKIENDDNILSSKHNNEVPEKNVHHHLTSSSNKESINKTSRTHAHKKLHNFIEKKIDMKRKKSIKLSNENVETIVENHGFVKRNGLYIPIIQSVVKRRASKIVKRAHAIVETGNLRTVLPSNTNRRSSEIRKEELRKFLYKKPASGKMKVLENFRLRNLMGK